MKNKSNHPLLVNDREYNYTIEPLFGKVHAEIYKVIKFKFSNSHISLLSKEFGSIFRKPNKKDYENAKKWADEQMECIFISNK